MKNNNIFREKCQQLYDKGFEDGREEMKKEIKLYLKELFEALNREIEGRFKDFKHNRHEIDVLLAEQTVLIQLMAEIRRF